MRGKADYLALGDHNAICDVCGFKFKASQLRRRWDGYMVCSQDYEQRHPQDLIRGVPDRQSVPWSRPVPTDTFVNPLAILYTEDNNRLTTESAEQIGV